MKTVQINNKYYQECDVVMLKSNKNDSKIRLNFNVVRSKHPYYLEQCARYDETQHIYILSNEAIKEQNWVFHKILDAVFQIDFKETTEEYVEEARHIKKVIATTDTSLKIYYDGKTSISKDWNGKQLAQIPQQFIEHYISEFNKDNIISKVLVEVEHIEKHSISNLLCDDGNFKLKLNQNNEVHIFLEKVESQSEKSYSREEVISLLYKHTEDIFRIKLNLEDWIKENLTK